MADENLLLVGCGILEKEISWLIEKNRWPVDTLFLPSTLHVDFEELSYSLTAALDKHQGRKSIVFYGCCHPLMEQILENAETFRTAGQNCLDMLLGHAAFTEELAQRAFFLLEDWARNWRKVTIKSFGENPKAISYVLQSNHAYILGLRTPCSGDFTVQAEEFASMADLPLRWMEVSLNHLESVLQAAMTRKIRENQWQR
jgi:hypothetical protein